MVGLREELELAVGDERFPARILQGNEDEVVSFENARELVERLPAGELVELPGEDHSFRGNERRMIEETLAFLSS